MLVVPIEDDSIVAVKRPRRARSENRVPVNFQSEDMESTKLRSKLPRKRTEKAHAAAVEKVPEDFRSVFLLDQPDIDRGKSEPHNILELISCFPFPMNCNLPENKDLLWLYSSPACGNEGCILCSASVKEPVFLEPWRLFSNHTEGDNEAMATLDNHHVVLQKFREDILQKLARTSYYTEPVPEQYRASYSKRRLNPDGTLKPPSAKTFAIQTKDYLIAPEYEGDKKTTCLGFCSSKRQLEHIFRKGYVFYCFKGFLHVYLDIGPTIFPNVVDSTFYTLIHYIVFNDQLKSRDDLDEFLPALPILGNNFDFPEFPIESLDHLKSHQLRSVSWMKSIEALPFSEDRILKTCSRNTRASPIKIKIGSTGLYVDVFQNLIVNKPDTIQEGHFEVMGGILLEEVSSGVSTGLGLIRASPFTDEHVQLRNDSRVTAFPRRIPSRASCVICSNYECTRKWIGETSLSSPGMKIISIISETERASVSWSDIMLADIVILSSEYYSDELMKPADFTSVQSELEDNFYSTGRVALELIQFHRIFFYYAPSAFHSCMGKYERLHADYRWCIVIHPKPDVSLYMGKLHQLVDLLHTISASTVFNNQDDSLGREFIPKFIKNGCAKEPDQKTTYETVLVISSENCGSPLPVGGTLDCNRSLLAAAHRYIIRLLETNPEARIALFTQTTSFSDLVSKTFNELKLSNVRMSGNLLQCQESALIFRLSKDIRVAISSSEDRAVGLDLTAATHVILLHPFWSGKGEAVDSALEKKCISRFSDPELIIRCK